MDQLVTLRLRAAMLARSEADRCYLARLVCGTCGPPLRLWRAEGPTLRLLIRGDAADATEYARRVAIGAQQVLGRGRRFDRCQLRPANPQDRDDLLRWRAEDPWDTASAVPDLLGWRRIAPWLRGPVERRLPPLITDWSHLEAATAAVFGHADLARRSLWRPAALTAAVHLAAPVLGTTRAAELLGVSPWTARRARQRAPRAAVTYGVVSQLRVRQPRRPGPGPRLAVGLSRASR